MCMNCGCGQMNNDMGNPDNITIKDVEKAAKATGESLDETLNNIRASIDNMLSESSNQPAK